MRCTKGWLCISANSDYSNQSLYPYCMSLHSVFVDSMVTKQGVVLMANALTRLHNLHSVLLFANAMSTFVGDMSHFIV